MRLLLSLLLVLALAVPATTAAVSGSAGATSAAASADAATKKKKKKKKRTSKKRTATQKTTSSSASATGDEREVKGRIASLSPLSVGSLTCKVPSGVSLAGFAVGDLVEITCDLEGGAWVLRKIKHEDDGGGVAGVDEREVKGTLTSLSPVTVGDLSCSPGTVSLSRFAVGDLVEMKCDLKGGSWVLRKIEHEDTHSSGGGDHDDDHDDDDDNSGSGSGSSGKGGGDDD